VEEYVADFLGILMGYQPSGSIQHTQRGLIDIILTVLDI